MNTIMRSLVDENLLNNLKNSNYVPTLNQYNDNNFDYNLGGTSSQLGVVF